MSFDKVKAKSTLSILKSDKVKKYDFVGFDIETSGENNDFLMGGLFYYNKSGEEIYKYFWKKEEMQSFFFKNRRLFRSKYIVATNLEFDFINLFEGSKYWNDFKLLFRGNLLVMVKEHKNKEIKSCDHLKFIDTMNYFPIGVEKWGKILKENKLEMPSSWENKTNEDNGVKYIVPRSNLDYNERKELETYNKQDCKISCKAMYLLQKGFNALGGGIKITSASSSLDLYRRVFQPINLIKEDYVLKNKNNEIRNFTFKSYYGGRTEVFQRGEHKNLFYYDINSLYPSAMMKRLPIPQSVKHFKKGIKENIFNFMGVSEVKVYCPETLNIPLLPFRKNEKLLFPTGTFKGVYTHEELKKAVSLGYGILEVFEQTIYTKSMRLFKDYVTSLYDKRKIQKENNDPLELVTKLCMNSLYGKLGMKKVLKTEFIKYTDFTAIELNKLLKERGIEEFTELGEYIVYRKEEEYNGKNCFPILASYITSYARLILYEYLNMHKESVVYCDTDSIFTYKPLNDKFVSKELGFMKLEAEISEAVFVKPKFYCYLEKESQNDFSIKIKGLNKANKEDFNLILKGGSVTKFRLSKFKESLRQHKSSSFNISFQEKKLGLDDEKRVWASERFSLDVQKSNPIELIDGEVFNRSVVENLMFEREQVLLDEIKNSDLFDGFSVGSDISEDEFIKNDMEMYKYE